MHSTCEKSYVFSNLFYIYTHKDPSIDLEDAQSLHFYQRGYFLRWRGALMHTYLLSHRKPHPWTR